MKNIIVKSFVGILAALLLNVVAFAQTPKRIDFAKEGSNSLVWEEKVAARSSKSFVFYAKKGQNLLLNMIDDTNQGSMDLGKISIEPNSDESFEMVIEVSKDYTFTVTNNSNKSTSFRISISLYDAVASNNQPTGERVQFAKGETSAMVTKDIPANGSVDFLFNVKKGQNIGYTVGYDFKDSDIQAFLTEPGMQDISKTSGPKEPQEFVANTSGDHRITVKNTIKKKVTITLYLDIESASGGATSNDVTGAYFSNKPLPRGFAEIEHLSLATIDENGNAAPLNGFIRPKKKTAKDYQLTNVKLNGKNLTFTTKSVGGVTYSFTGTFTRTNVLDSPPTGNEVILKGTLSRLIDGEASDETQVSFIYELGD